MAKKNCKKTLRNYTFIGYSEKLQHIPGNREGHVHVYDGACAQVRPEKALIFHLWLTFTVCTSTK